MATHDYNNNNNYYKINIRLTAVCISAIKENVSLWTSSKKKKKTVFVFSLRINYKLKTIMGSHHNQAIKISCMEKFE